MVHEKLKQKKIGLRLIIYGRRRKIFFWSIKDSFIWVVVAVVVGGDVIVVVV
jgi:hypothetical protein